MDEQEREQEATIKFRFRVMRFTTLLDGTRRAHIDFLPDTDPQVYLQFIEAQDRPGIALDVAGVAVDLSKILTELDNETEKGAEAGSPGVDRRRIDLRRNK